MKAVAASSITQYERAVAALQDYHRTVELGLRACGGAGWSVPEPAAAGTGPIGAVVFGSDQGLVGRFNESLMEFAMQAVVHGQTPAHRRTPGGQPGSMRVVWAVGERMQTLLERAGVEVRPFPVPNSVDGIAPLVGRLLADIEAAREEGAVQEVRVFHNGPRAAALYEPRVTRLLPLDADWRKPIAAVPWPTRQTPQLIEGAVTALEAFVREYLFIRLFQAGAESLASENASRLAAMQRAEKNIEGMLETMTRTFHQIRQEAIDEELFDVLAAFAPDR